jgi:glycosyltransferase involved in cell wall biosynthesis
MPLVIDWIDWWGRGGLIQEQRPFWYRVFFGALETHYEEHFRRQADGTTVISHALGDRAESLGVERSTIFWIPGGAPVDLLKPLPQAVARQRFGLPQDCFILGFFALDVTFDAELVFHATRIVLKSHPQTLLIMTGNKSSQLEELAARTGIGRSFRHFGRRPYNEELAALFSCADVFLLPFTDKIANRGRWPNKIGDYLCLGRPTVTNPVGEMKILFEQEAVGLLAGESPGQMAEAILRLAHNQDLCLRMGDRARRVAEEKFAWPRIAEMLEECYRITADRFLARAAPL